MKLSHMMSMVVWMSVWISSWWALFTIDNQDVKILTVVCSIMSLISIIVFIIKVGEEW